MSSSSSVSSFTSTKLLSGVVESVIERRLRYVENRNTSGDARSLPDAPMGVPDSFD